MLTMFHTPDVLITNGTQWGCLYPDTKSGLNSPPYRLAEPYFEKLDKTKQRWCVDNLVLNTRHFYGIEEHVLNGIF